MLSEFQKVATVADRLQEAMRIRQKRQADLVKDTGIAKGTINNYVKGKYEPKSPTIQRLAQALLVSEKWLDGYDVPMERLNIKAIASKPICKNIQKIREDRNISTKHLAELLNVNESVVLDIESGKQTLDKDMLFRICDILGTTPDFIDGTIVELLESGDIDAEYRYTRQLNSPDKPKLTEGEQELLDMFRLVPEDKQRFFLQMLKTFTESFT